MEQFVNLEINTLPVPTWNQLSMNNTKIALSAYPPELRVIGEEVAASTTFSLEKIATGMGESMRQLQMPKKISICIKENTKVQKTWEILCDKNNEGYFASEIRAMPQSDTTIFQFISGTKATEGVCALQTKMKLEEYSHVKLVQIQLLEKPFRFLNDIGVSCEKNAQFELIQLFLGDADTYTGCYTVLNGKKSQFSADIGYYAKGNRKIDMNYIADHLSPKTESQIRANGVLDDTSQKIFRGTIDFKNGSSGSVGAETENILILGEKAINRTVPLILCAEEDVQGSHGASIGQPDEDVLYYMGTRGISETEACCLLARSKIDAVCRRIGDESIRCRVEKYLTEVMRFGKSN